MSDNTAIVIVMAMFFAFVSWGVWLSSKNGGRAMRELKPEEAICPVCGCYCLGRGGHGCIDKPSMLQPNRAKVVPQDTAMHTTEAEREQNVVILRTEALYDTRFVNRLIADARLAAQRGEQIETARKSLIASQKWFEFDQRSRIHVEAALAALEGTK